MSRLCRCRKSGGNRSHHHEQWNPSALTRHLSPFPFDYRQVPARKRSESPDAPNTDGLSSRNEDVTERRRTLTISAMLSWDERFSERYDEWSAGMTADVPFYVELARRADGPI